MTMNYNFLYSKNLLLMEGEILEDDYFAQCQQMIFSINKKQNFYGQEMSVL